MLVSLEGLPGCGKSTTAELLGHRSANWQFEHERSAEHPFLDAFYSDIERYKFETELCFVLIHYHQYRDLAPPVGGVLILDFSPVKDLVFADLNLSGDEYALFTDLYRLTSGTLNAPDLTIFFELEVDHALERIASRGRPYESGMDASYLDGLNEAYRARLGELGGKVERLPVGRKSTRENVVEAVAELIER